MKLLLKKIVGFGMLALATVILLSIINKSVLDQYFEPTNYSVKATTLIMGDSHAATGIDPIAFDNAMNVSLHSEHPFYTFHKLKWLLVTDSHIDTVICTIAHHGLAGDETVRSEGYLQTMLPKYIPIIKPINEGHALPLLNKTVELNRAIYNFGLIHSESAQYTTNQLLGNYHLNDLRFIGGFLAKNGNNLSEEALSKTVKKHYKNRRFGEAKLYAKYLLEIAKLCQNKGIKFVAIATPLHTNYQKNIPQGLKSEFLAFQQDLINEGAHVLNYAFTTNLPDSIFGDHDHMNETGAAFISKSIAGDMNLP